MGLVGVAIAPYPHGPSIASARSSSWARTCTTACPAGTIPLLEYLVKWNRVNQLFFKQPLEPRDGVIHLTDAPGLGVELDEGKATERRELTWE